VELNSGSDNRNESSRLCLYVLQLRCEAGAQALVFCLCDRLEFIDLEHGIAVVIGSRNYNGIFADIANQRDLDPR
jgi:hypothetical protein